MVVTIAGAIDVGTVDGDFDAVGVLVSVDEVVVIGVLTVLRACVVVV